MVQVTTKVKDRANRASGLLHLGLCHRYLEAKISPTHSSRTSSANTFERISSGAGATAQWSKAHAVLAGDQSSAPNTSLSAQMLFSSRPRGSNANHYPCKPSLCCNDNSSTNPHHSWELCLQDCHVAPWLRGKQEQPGLNRTAYS